MRTFFLSLIVLFSIVLIPTAVMAQGANTSETDQTVGTSLPDNYPGKDLNELPTQPTYPIDHSGDRSGDQTDPVKCLHEQLERQNQVIVDLASTAKRTEEKADLAISKMDQVLNSSIDPGTRRQFCERRARYEHARSEARAARYRLMGHYITAVRSLAVFEKSMKAKYGMNLQEVVSEIKNLQTTTATIQAEWNHSKAAIAEIPELVNTVNGHTQELAVHEETIEMMMLFFYEKNPDFKTAVDNDPGMKQFIETCESNRAKAAANASAGEQTNANTAKGEGNTSGTDQATTGGTTGTTADSSTAQSATSEQTATDSQKQLEAIQKEAVATQKKLDAAQRKLDAALRQTEATSPSWYVYGFWVVAVVAAFLLFVVIFRRRGNQVNLNAP